MVEIWARRITPRTSTGNTATPTRLGPYSSLDERNKAVIQMRKEGASLGEIAGVVGVSRERIRQIVKRHDSRELRASLVGAGHEAIYFLPVSFRTFNQLDNYGIKTRSDYLKLTRNQLARVPNIGVKSFNEAEVVIAGRQPVDLAEYLRLKRRDSL